MWFRQRNHTRPNFSHASWWYVQKTPYKKRLPRALNVRQVTASPFPRDTGVLQTYRESDFENAHSKAYDDLKASLGDSSQLAASLAEWRSSANSINDNAQQLLMLAIAVRKRQWKAIPVILGKKRRSQKWHRRLPTEFANRWLEYSFGWKPLIQDIWNALDVLQRPPPPQVVRGRGTSRGQWIFKGPVPNRETFVCQSVVRVQLIGDVEVSNPNLWLLNQLGLINPASVAWELVPWSFVVDWFTNLGQVIGSVTDFAGLTLSDTATTVTGYTTTSYTWVEPNGSLYDYFVGSNLQVARTSGFQSPAIYIKPFHGFSVARGANALSLAIQQLRL